MVLLRRVNTPEKKGQLSHVSITLTYMSSLLRGISLDYQGYSFLGLPLINVVTFPGEIKLLISSYTPGGRIYSSYLR